MMISEYANKISVELLDLQKEDQNFNQVVCKKGCSYCCHKIVEISIFEAVRLAEVLVRLSSEELLRIRKKAKENSLINFPIKTDNERWKLQLPCPLLHENSCSLYEHRPYQCIFTNSTSLKKCENQFKNKKESGHKALKWLIDGDDLLSARFRTAQLFYRHTAELNEGEKFFSLLIELDLDRFLAYFIEDSLQLMQLKFAKLNSLDMDIFKKLEKKTLSYEHPIL